MEMRTEWIAYVRAHATDVWSQEAQERAVRAIIPSEAHVVVISDCGKAVSRADRPALRELLDRVNEGSVAGLAVYDLSRLSRSLRTLSSLLTCIRERGIELRVVTMPGASSPSFEDMLTRFAEFDAQFRSIAAHTARLRRRNA